ncbi:hypothetical protein [Clostridium sp.]|uniref:hypothetical protein n=1 Tax=Clostridium sp. TaxID=1506 RepID=UPI002FC7D516
MIKEIIRYIYENKDFSTSGISKGLGLSEGIVDQYKEKLLLSGYIYKEESCSSEACKKCSCGCNDKMLNPILQWGISDKGINLIKREVK